MKHWLPHPGRAVESPVYETKFSTYPDTITVVVTDGYEEKRIRYRRDIAQPAPHLLDGLHFDWPKRHEKK